VVAAACLAPAAHADVTFTHDTTNHVYLLQNDYIAAAIGDTGFGGNNSSNFKLVGLYKLTGAGAATLPLTLSSTPNHVQASYPTYLNRVNTASTSYGTLAVTQNIDGDDSAFKISLGADGTISSPALAVTMIYRLRDHSKTLEAEIRYTNNTGSAWTPANVSNGAESIAYLEPNATMTGSEAQVKTVSGMGIVTTGTGWFGNATGASSSPSPELAEGFVSCVNKNTDPAKTIDAVLTWDFANQQAHSQAGAANGLTSNKVYVGGNRFQLQAYYTLIAAGETLDRTQNITLDDGMPVVSHADSNCLAGVSLNNTAYNQGATVGATFQVNSLTTTDATYDIKNITVVSSTGTSTGITAPDITGLAANNFAHVSAARQLVLPSTLDTSATYAVTADLYSGGSKVSTLVSKGFLVNAADVKVALYLDPSSGNYILENENLKAVINPSNAYVGELDVKSVNRNQAASGYPMFRDAISNPSRLTFSGFQVVLDPNGTDSPTKKSIQFLNGYNALSNLNKTFTLESTSKTLQVDLAVQSVIADPITGWGFYCDVASQAGGSGGSEDQFTAHSANGLMYNFPVPADPGYSRYWFGCTPQADNTALIAGSQPELDQPWMAASDTVNGDALATSWDHPTQVSYSGTPTDGTVPVTMNCIFRGGENAAGEGRRHVMEPHYDNIPAGSTLNYTLYTMADTGMKTVSYAEGKRVMAGLWNNGGDLKQGDTLSYTLSYTNVGTTSRTFNVTGIQLVKDTGETTAAGPVLDPVALAAGANVSAPLTFVIPGTQALGTYHLEGNLYEGGAKVATLQSLPFNVTAGAVAPNGDVNGDGKVDAADVALALSIAGGLTTADSGNLARGDIWPATPDKAITLEDAVAIARNVGGL
jgi:hypothetical protein